MQSKYIHSCGVRHDDIKPENILIDQHSGRSFLFDFDVSSRMNDYSNGTTLEYASRKWHTNKIRNAVDDWESFFYTCCYIHYVKLDWLFKTDLSQYSLSLASQKCFKWKNNIEKTIVRLHEFDLFHLNFNWNAVLSFNFHRPKSTDTSNRHLWKKYFMLSRIKCLKEGITNSLITMAFTIWSAIKFERWADVQNRCVLRGPVLHRME